MTRELSLVPSLPTATSHPDKRGKAGMALLHAGQCSPATARALTDQLRQSLVISWELLVEAYQRRAWSALGYESWDAYTDAELGETRLRLPREERREVVASMTEAGMSTRAISSALGVSKNTVTEDRQQVSQIGTPDEPIDAEIVDEAPKSVLGTDGKSYTVAPLRAAPRRKPLPEAFWQAAYDLTKVTERIARLADDDRFPHNGERVAASNRSDLIRAIDAVQGVVDRLPHSPDNLAIPQPPKYGGNRRKHLQILQSVTASLSGLVIAVDDITELDTTVTKEEAAQLVRDLSQQIRSLNQIKNLLKERTS